MRAAAVHATKTFYATSILGSAFRPGHGLWDFLGEGVYFYLVSGEGGFADAAACATAVSKRKYGQDVTRLVADLDLSDALNLQHHEVYAALQRASRVFKAKLAETRVWIAPNEALFRPDSHMRIEVFRRCVEVLAGRDVGSLVARFPVANEVIEGLPAPEVCVKRPSAILDVRAEDPAASPPAPVRDPADWPCPPDFLAAARGVGDYIDSLRNSDFVDCITAVHQGADAYWRGSKPRFAPFGEIRLLAEGDAYKPALAGIEPVCARYGRSLLAYDLTSVRRGALSLARQRLFDLVDGASGLILVLTPTSSEVLAALIRALEKPDTPPTLVLLTEGMEPPMAARARQNVVCAPLQQRTSDRINPVMEGFLRDGWGDAARAHALELKLAARHGDAAKRSRDLRRILEAYDARPRLLL